MDRRCSRRVQGDLHTTFVAVHWKAILVIVDRWELWDRRQLVLWASKIVGIERVAFDRSGFKYHGRIKALAEAAREAGLKF